VNQEDFSDIFWNGRSRDFQPIVYKMPYLCSKDYKEYEVAQMADIDLDPCPTTVVITGIGLITPYGTGMHPFEDALKCGRSCISEMRAYDLSRCTARKGGYFYDYRPEDFDGSAGFARTARSTQFAIISVDQALKDSQIDMEAVFKDRIGLVLSSTRSSLEKTERFYHALATKGPRFVNPLAFQESVHNAPISHISIRYGLSGPSLAVTSGGVGTVQAIAIADQWLQSRRVDVVVVVSAESLNAISHEAYSHARGHAPVRRGGTDECCPFDRRRNGFVFGEGANAFVLERGEDARRRHANARARVVGYAVVHAATRVGCYDRSGTAFHKSMDAALCMSGRSPSQVDWILADANSSVDGDIAETAAIKKLFQAGSIPPVTAIKSVLGETEGASGGFALLAAIFGLRGNTVYPTVNYQEEDPECDLDCVPNRSRSRVMRTTLINTSTFGGSCGSLVIEI